MSYAYDEILYEGFPFDQTHPDRLATIARLFGMKPAPVDACRMLELGCGDGGNLIPMAYTLPASRFVGIDAGERGISKGCSIAQSLGLQNLDLLHLDIMETGALGSFDYIVAHGVYSWTPPAVQDRILATCRELLSPHGVAYISYSVYPGAHIRGMVSEMLRYQADRFADPQQKIEQARAMLLFLAGAGADDDPYSMLLRQQVERVAARHPATVYHDELAECHQPIYFREFAQRAARHELQYLGEADFFEMQECGQPSETVAMLRRIAGDLIEREQLLDFLKCRRFRQTLLCRAEVALDRRVGSGLMRGFSVRAARMRNEEEPAPPPITNHPMAAAANEALQEEWPAALTFEELLAAVRARGCGGADDAELLQDLVLAHFVIGRFQLHTRAPEFARRAGNFPRASALARLQARSSPFVASLCHRLVHIEDDLSRVLLQAMDGSRDRAGLLHAVRSSGAPGADQATSEELERSVETLAKLALLEA